LFTEEKPVGDLSPSVQLKLGRAAEHLDSIRQLTNEWEKAELYETVQEPDDESDDEFEWIRFVARVGGPPLPADEMATRLGDCLQNYRSVLDHLIWELSVLASGSPPPQPRRISFPAYDDAAKFSRQGLHAVANDAADEVERMQPYHDGAKAHENPLWLLCELSNIDKHRTIHVVNHYSPGIAVDLTPEVAGSVVEQREPGPVEDGAVLARVCWPRPELERVEIETRVRVTRGVAILETPETPLVHLGTTIDAIRSAVEDAADRLRIYLP
jgi:hypothetical protein